eukprot:CAMPEP_0170536728 /NCGR_PEP_ID=MMETSP0209-20121228/102304_1 /TAXON_ID=665100 ORGANISM="Litonotus pictus, Strain P1" /NCGR_SAMPLE_ID=MMETSP0209 /ASSEMBLY_ACC=CAM_ASM_000301 /LENGTH=1474 /DNA_ID=CAMNT_0010838123 /DNA_START=2584 /DNA_END=7008 /DNA_ORIENTATION=+
MNEIVVEEIIKWSHSILVSILECDYLKQDIEPKLIVSKSVKKKKIKHIILSDERKLKIIISQIIKNSIKFTHRGQISIIISQKEKEDEIIISIKDSGVGMKKNKLEELLKTNDEDLNDMNDLFVQKGGLGIGLKIVTQLCHKLNIGFNMESTHEQGTQVDLKFKVNQTRNYQSTSNLYLQDLEVLSSYSKKNTFLEFRRSRNDSVRNDQNTVSIKNLYTNRVSSSSLIGKNKKYSKEGSFGGNFYKNLTSNNFKYSTNFKNLTKRSYFYNVKEAEDHCQTISEINNVSSNNIDNSNNLLYNEPGVIKGHNTKTVNYYFNNKFTKNYGLGNLGGTKDKKSRFDQRKISLEREIDNNNRSPIKGVFVENDMDRSFSYKSSYENEKHNFDLSQSLKKPKKSSHSVIRCSPEIALISPSKEISGYFISHKNIGNLGENEQKIASSLLLNNLPSSLTQSNNNLTLKKNSVSESTVKKLQKDLGGSHTSLVNQKTPSGNTAKENSSLGLLSIKLDPNIKKNIVKPNNSSRILNSMLSQSYANSNKLTSNSNLNESTAKNNFILENLNNVSFKNTQPNKKKEKERKSKVNNLINNKLILDNDLKMKNNNTILIENKSSDDEKEENYSNNLKILGVDQKKKEKDIINNSNSQMNTVKFLNNSVLLNTLNVNPSSTKDNNSSAINVKRNDESNISHVHTNSKENVNLSMNILNKSNNRAKHNIGSNSDNPNLDYSKTSLNSNQNRNMELLEKMKQINYKRTGNKRNSKRNNGSQNNSLSSFKNTTVDKIEKLDNKRNSKRNNGSQNNSFSSFKNTTVDKIDKLDKITGLSIIQRAEDYEKGRDFLGSQAFTKMTLLKSIGGGNNNESISLSHNATDQNEVTDSNRNYASDFPEKGKKGSLKSKGPPLFSSPIEKKECMSDTNVRLKDFPVPTNRKSTSHNQKDKVVTASTVSVFNIPEKKASNRKETVFLTAKNISGELGISNTKLNNNSTFPFRSGFNVLLNKPKENTNDFYSSSENRLQEPSQTYNAFKQIPENTKSAKTAKILIEKNLHSRRNLSLIVQEELKEHEPGDTSNSEENPHKVNSSNFENRMNRLGRGNKSMLSRNSHMNSKSFSCNNDLDDNVLLIKQSSKVKQRQAFKKGDINISDNYLETNSSKGYSSKRGERENTQTIVLDVDMEFIRQNFENIREEIRKEKERENALTRQPEVRRKQVNQGQAREKTNPRRSKKVLSNMNMNMNNISNHMNSNTSNTLVSCKNTSNNVSYKKRNSVLHTESNFQNSMLTGGINNSRLPSNMNLTNNTRNNYTNQNTRDMIHNRSSLGTDMVLTYKSPKEIIEDSKISDKPKILIVDDVSYCRSSVRNILKKILKDKNLDYELIEEDDGIGTINRVFKDRTFNNNKIRLIISDENMNFINGSESFSTLSSLESKGCFGNKVSKVILTAIEDPEALGNLQIKGNANAVYKKPANKIILHEMVNKFLVNDS